jgi:lysozyme family protein
MATVPYKFTTTASTNLQVVRAGQTANLKGLSVANVATAIYVKFYWFSPSGSASAPTVGTTVPNLTVGVVASANTLQSWPDGITGNGELWVAVTAAAADSDSANAASGAVVTLLVE